MKPCVRWVGGKQFSLNRFKRYLPPIKIPYVELFVGSGAFLFHYMPKNAIINDINPHLINMYNTIKSQPKLLVKNLLYHDLRNCEEYYFEIRDNFNEMGKEIYQNCDNAIKLKMAGYFLYINGRCFNGLYRENSRGEFNVGYCKEDNPHMIKKIVDIENLYKISKYLRDNHILIFNRDYIEIIDAIMDGIKTLDGQNIEMFSNSKLYFVFDPPYSSLDGQNNFTQYNSSMWNHEKTEELSIQLKRLNSSNHYFIMFNAYSEYIMKLFNDFKIIKHKVRRNVSCNSESRIKVEEIIVMNKGVKNLDDYI